MSKGIAVDSSLEARQQIDTLFSLDRRPMYLAHVPAFHSALRLDRLSDYVLLTINSNHLKHEPATNEPLSMCLGDEDMF